jgi:hypothetical protein
LAAFEQKAVTGEQQLPRAGGGQGTTTPVVGLSRSSSVSRSESYGIERLPPSLSRRTTAADADVKPGNLSGVMDDSFKRKLEDMTGSMAEKLQKKASTHGLTAAAASSSSSSSATPARGPAALAAKKRLIPQDVMDVIVLSGVDQELAVNEYLQTHGLAGATAQGGNLGRTKTWDHDELMRQIQDVSGSVTPEARRSGGRTPEGEAVESKAERAEPGVELAETKAVDAVAPAPVKEVQQQSAIVPDAAVISSPVGEERVEEKTFNAASLPSFA